MWNLRNYGLRSTGSILFSCFIFHLLLHTTLCQDLQLYGKANRYLVPLDQKEIGQVIGKCFQGLQFTTCVPHGQNFDGTNSYYYLPYYMDLPKIYGSMYCAQCCGDSPNQIDTWNLMCKVDAVTAATSNLYGYEFRLARNAYKGDREVIICPIKRSACQYDGKTTLSCDGLATDDTYLVGYTLTLTVQQYDQNFKYWRGLSNCEVESVESKTPLSSGDNFHEVLIMIHHPNPEPLDAPKTLFILISIYFFAYCTLYFCRRKDCVYCTKKLVFSRELCYFCKFVGAERPDDFLLLALEEKGAYIQGEMPERFPGSRYLLEKIRKHWPNFPYVRYKPIEPVPYSPRVAEAEREAKKIYEENLKQEYRAAKAAWLEKGNDGIPKGWYKNEKDGTFRKIADRGKEKHINPNRIEFPPLAIYAGIGHHDPSYQLSYYERLKKEIAGDFDTEATDEEGGGAGAGAVQVPQLPLVQEPVQVPPTKAGDKGKGLKDKSKEKETTRRAQPAPVGPQIPDVAQAIEIALNNNLPEPTWWEKSVGGPRKRPFPRFKLYNETVESYLQLYNPAKVPTISDLLTKYKRRERLLLKKIIQKYGYNPICHSVDAGNSNKGSNSGGRGDDGKSKKKRTKAEEMQLAEQKARAATINAAELPAGVPTINEAVEAALETLQKQTFWQRMFAPKRPPKKHFDKIVQSYLEVYNPSKLQGLPQLLEKYKGNGKEKILLKMLINKYGYTPRLHSLEETLSSPFPPPPPQSSEGTPLALDGEAKHEDISQSNALSLHPDLQAFTSGNPPHLGVHKHIN